MPNSLLERHRRLKRIGNAMLDGKSLADRDRQFIAQALVRIGDGADANEELGTKLRKGERSYKTSLQRHFRDRAALAWIAAAKAPESEGGLGLTLEAALELLEDVGKRNIFGIEADTLRKYWNNRPSDRRREFTVED